MGEFDGRRVLVTGAGRGIGRETARAFAAEGARLVLAGRDPAALEAVAAELRAKTDVRAVPADVSRVGDCRRLVEETVRLLGGLDILVNNAGTITRSPFLGTTEAEWDAVLDTNLKGMFFLSQAAAEAMRPAGFGKIVNVASVIGFMAAFSPYAVSKWGVIGLTRGLAKELAQYGIRVNAVAPGITNTAMMNYDENTPLESAAVPLGRVTRTGEVAAAILFLAGPRADHITGAVLPVDGGQMR